ncbi:hypothetical protein [Lysinibacillus sp. NPDC047702]|uniref:hypothetical protein n=1 Tax=unclassified Lysinibacillus TaxID=2636778 RepID=UPI003CFE80D7
MVILKDHSSKPSCEVEIKLKLVNDGSVKFRIDFRTGPAFPEIHTEISCLKRDFLKLLDDLKQIDHTHLSMLEPHDPGLCIYHIPEYGTYYYPEYGLFQVPEHEREENEPRFKLIFVLDAKEKNNYGLRECGPALCLIVKMEQINQFVDSLKLEVTNFSNI